MSLITERLWTTEFDPPMPEAMDYQLFYRLREQKYLGQQIDNLAALIESLLPLKDTPGVQQWICREQLNLANAYRRLAR